MQFIRKFVIYLLKKFASKILRIYKPCVIGITGNVGKSSTSEAIFSVLSSRFRVRKNIKNYNNEIGIPLTIIGEVSGGRSIFSWIKIFIKAVSLCIFRGFQYPKILVLEMGVDHPGDMGYLMRFIPVKIGIVTAIDPEYPVHLEFFKDVHHLAKEKMKIATALNKNETVLLNADSPLITSWTKKIKAKIITFGFSSTAQIRASDIAVGKKLATQNGGMSRGVSFKLWHQGSVVPVFLPHALGVHQVYAGLAAAAVGVLFDMNLIAIAEALKNYQTPAGRMRLISGIKKTYLIDDTYNASPLAMKAALETLGNFNGEGKKYACLGDMAELGSQTRRAHAAIGSQAAAIADVVCTVGMSGKMIAESAIASGLSSDNVFEFSRAEEAGRFLQDRLHPEDIVLVKGSQKMRMEKVVKELMAEPNRASELLVRQEKEWQ